MPFTVAGVFEAPGTVMESEVWFDRTDLVVPAEERKGTIQVEVIGPEVRAVSVADAANADRE